MAIVELGLRTSGLLIVNVPQEVLMKGDKRLIEALNGLLADELTAINQYMVHSEMCDDWGY